MPRFIDIHAHILPGVDDGSQDLETSLGMARIAARSGTTRIVCTKHTDLTEPVTEEDRDLVLEGVRVLQNVLKREDIPLQLLPGMEIMASEDIYRKLRDGLFLGLNDSRYFMIEFPFDAPPDYISFVLSEMRKMRGLVPLIAHPERYYCVQEDPELIYGWVMDGCLTQCNRASFEGKFGSLEAETSLRLLDANLVACIASDAHSDIQRTPRLDIGYHEIEKQFGKWTAELLLHAHPKMIIQNDTLEMRGTVRHICR